MPIIFWLSGKKGATDKIRDDANDAKLKELVDCPESPERRLILRLKNTGSWMSVWINMVTDILLAATDFLIFCAHVIMLPPPNLKKETDSLHNSPYVTDLFVATEAS